MSILAAATQPSLPPPRVMVVGGIFVALVVLGIAYITRLLRPRSLTLPDRLPAHRSGALLLVVTVVGAGIWMGGQIGYLIVSSIIKAGPQGNIDPTRDFDPANLTPIA